MAKLFIRAQSRPGFPGVYRGGRLWNGGEDTEVELVETEDGSDPEQEPGGPIRIGKNTVKSMEDDGRFSIRETKSAGDMLANAQTIEVLRAENDRLTQELRDLRAQMSGTSNDDQGDSNAKVSPEAPLPYLGGDDKHEAGVAEAAHKGHGHKSKR